MYFQKATISHPSLSFALVNKTSSFMPALWEPSSPFHPGACHAGACSTHAQVWILKHEWTELPDNISTIVLAKSINVFPILEKNFPHLIHPEITCPFLHSGHFVPLIASCGWLAFSSLFLLCPDEECHCWRTTGIHVLWPRGWNSSPLSLGAFRKWFSLS